MLSMRIVTLCGNSICKLLSMIFNGCLEEAKFPSDCKKAHVVPVRKKGDQQCLNQQCLPIFSKIFKRLIYNELFTFSTDNKLTSPNQSGFRPGDSCVNQLLMKYISRLMTDLK